MDLNNCTMAIMRETKDSIKEYDVTPLKRLLSHEPLFPDFPDTGFTINSEDPDIELFQELQFTIAGLYSKNCEKLKSDESFKLAMHSQRMWTAAIQLVYRWQCYGCAPLLRTALEAMSYALIISTDPSKGEAWKARHSGDEGKKINKKAFQQPMADARNVLNKRDKALGDWIYDIYQTLIDDGAHPNPRGIEATEKFYFGNVEMKFGERLRDQYSNFSFLTKGSIIHCLQVGVAIYRVSLETLDINTPENIKKFHDLKPELRNRVDAYNISLKNRMVR